MAYQDHFENFLRKQTEKVQNKIYKVIEAIETLERVPKTYLQPIKTKKGLFEARIQLGSNIWRVFCFFDEGQLVILLNGFQKKSQKTPPKEIEKASKLMDQYFAEKESVKKKRKERSHEYKKLEKHKR